MAGSLFAKIKTLQYTNFMWSEKGLLDNSPKANKHATLHYIT